MKKTMIFIMCLLMTFSFMNLSVSADYNYQVVGEGQTLLYSEHNGAQIFDNDMVEAQLTVGWYREPVMRLYAEGKSEVFGVSQVEAQLTVGWYKEPVTRVYCEGNSELIPSAYVNSYLESGWYLEPVRRLYAPGKSAVFPESQVAAQLTVGWHTLPFIRMTATDGRVIYVREDEVPAYENVGWSYEVYVPIYKLANKASLTRGLTDDEFRQAYDLAKELVMPVIYSSRDEQLSYIAFALRYLFEYGMQYSMTADNYNNVYGFFVDGAASCAGCTRATGLCLNILGIAYEHVNENQYSHQWCRVNVDGTYWICDAYGLYCGPEPAPYSHPFFS